MATLQSGFTASLYFGVPLFPYEIAPVPVPPVSVSSGSSHPYMDRGVGILKRAPAFETPTVRPTKKYPTIYLEPYGTELLRPPKLDDYIVRPKRKSINIQDILNDDDEILMIL